MLLSVNSTFSQFYNSRYLIPYRENNLWGFSDTLGNIRIKPVYDKTNFFYFIDMGYYAPVYKENKKSFINDTGKLVFPFSDSLVQLNDEYYTARENNKFGVYHLRYKLIVPFVYDTFMYVKDYPRYKQGDDYVQIPKHYRIIGRKDKKYYLITYLNNNTEEIGKPEPATAPKKPAAINGDNSFLVAVDPARDRPVTTVSVAELFPQSRISVLKQNKKMGIVNEKKIVLVPCIYDSISIINDNLLITLKKKKYGAVFFNSVYKGISNKYDKLEYATSLGVTNQWYFLIFRAVKNNKTGYVGENGVEYFTN